MFYVYILYSKSLDRYYIGMSSDVKARLEKHLQNHRGFTSRAKDWEVVYTESYSTKSEALVREKQLKSWKSRAMIEKLLD